MRIYLDIRKSGYPEIRISANRISRFPDIRKPGFPEIRIFGNPEIRKSGYPDIQKSGYPDFRKSGFPDIRIFWLLWMDESAGKGKSGIRACTSAHPRELSIRAGDVPFPPVRVCLHPLSLCKTQAWFPDFQRSRFLAICNFVIHLRIADEFLRKQQ